ncbi:MAG: hypothetical protein IKY45_00590 [Clostridia bacterium]|nr:hypothetical protein [Clostridia bacterium]
MACGICALLGVIIGAIISKGIDIKIPERKANSTKKEEKEAKDKLNKMAEQWENLLNYDGGKQ